MPNTNQPSQEVADYIATLPEFIRESIEQTGLSFQTVQELKSFVDNLNEK